MRNFDWDKKKKRFWTQSTKTFAQRQVPNCIGSPFSRANHVLNGVCCRIEINMHRRPGIDEGFMLLGLEALSSNKSWTDKNTREINWVIFSHLQNHADPVSESRGPWSGWNKMAGEAGVVSLLPSSNSTRLVHSDHP